MLGRGIVAERLVRPFVVVEALEAAQAPDLLAQASRRRIGGILQQRQMQPFQTAVLLRLAGCNALRHDASLDHLDRELRQAARRIARRRSGGPLSERSRSGKPNSRNAASSTGQT